MHLKKVISIIEKHRESEIKLKFTFVLKSLDQNLSSEINRGMNLTKCNYKAYELAK